MERYSVRSNFITTVAEIIATLYVCKILSLLPEATQPLTEGTPYVLRDWLVSSTSGRLRQMGSLMGIFFKTRTGRLTAPGRRCKAGLIY